LRVPETTLAHRDEVNPRAEVRIDQEANSGKAAERYVPSTGRARSELGLEEWIDLREGIRRTAAWHTDKPKA